MFTRVWKIVVSTITEIYSVGILAGHVWWENFPFDQKILAQDNVVIWNNTLSKSGRLLTQHAFLFNLIFWLVAC